MKRKFEILTHADLSQIQMWLNQKNTTKGELKIETPFYWDHGSLQYVIIVSYNDK